MPRRFMHNIWMPACCVCLLSFTAVAAEGDAKASGAGELYAPPGFGDVQTATLEWVAAQPGKDPKVLEAVGAVWADIEDSTPAKRLSQVVESFSVTDPETRRFIARCDLMDGPLIPDQIEPLLERQTAEFYTNNMSLFYGKYLAQRRMYDEALDLLEPLDPHQVVDPASCLFYKAVCQHQLLMKAEGLETLGKLLTDTEGVPVAYSSVATLMQYELQNLKSKSLEEITRMMSDVERRLDVGQGGHRVQKKEQEIVALLDEMIEKMEQGNGGGGGGGASGNQPSAPAGDSSVGGQQGPGNVDRKPLGNKSGWGALPPKQEARAKQLIDRNFPPYYREAIEEYNKKLTNRRAQQGR